MALELTKEPDFLSLSKNRIDVIIQTDNYILIPGTNTSFAITIDSIPGIEDKYMRFVFPSGEVIEFVTKNTLDDSGTNIPATGSGLTAYTDAVKEAMQKNYSFDKYFNITRSGSTITFEAKEQTAETFVTFFTDFADFVWEGVDVIGSEPTYNPNFSIGLDIYIEPVKWSGEYVALPTICLKPDADQNVKVDISDKINSFVKSDFFKTIATYELCGENCKRYYFKYYEIYGNNPTEKIINTSSVYYVLSGGLRFIDFNSSVYSGYMHFYNVQKPWLTWKKTRRIVTSQTEYLYWFNNYERIAIDPDARPIPYEGIYLKAKIFYTDSTDETQVIYTDSTSIIGDVVAYNVGFDHMNLASFSPSKTIKKYQVWLEAQFGTVLTENIFFYIQEDNARDKIFFYENSLGAIETLRTTGAFEFSNETSADEVINMISPGSDKSTLTGEIYQKNTKSRDSVKASTGGISTKADMILLKELMNSEFTISIDPLTGIYTRILITKGKWVICIDDDTLYGIEFEYADAFYNDGHSKF